MDILKKWWFWIIVVLLIILLFPKRCGFGVYYGYSDDERLPYDGKECCDLRARGYCIGLISKKERTISVVAEITEDDRSAKKYCPFVTRKETSDGGCFGFKFGEKKLGRFSCADARLADILG